MNSANKIILIMGIAYTAIGSVVSLVIMRSIGFNIFTLIPLLFLIIGIAFIIGVTKSITSRNKIKKFGKKYAAKIYGYVDNTSYRVNGVYTINTKVHFFDDNGIEKEVIIPTSFPRGSNAYPIGMTMDIFEYNGNYSFDPKSVRDEILPRENELMDDKPVEPEKLSIISVTCDCCGATYEAAKGYSNKCPYCGVPHNN